MPKLNEVTTCPVCKERIRHIKSRGESVAVDNEVICVFQAPGEFARMENGIEHVCVVFGKRWGVEIAQNEEFIVTTFHKDTCGKKTLDGVWKTTLEGLEAMKQREETALEGAREG